MIDRTLWDPTDRYADGVMKIYDHWCLEVSFRQHTLGCFIIFCRRPNVRLMSQLRPEESAELIHVMGDIERALRLNPVFHADHFNYLQMGNSTPSLHFHGVPRYESPRRFQEKDWIDGTWGHPVAWVKEEVSKELIIAIREELTKSL